MSSIEEAFKARIAALGTPAADRVFREAIEQEPDMPAIAFTRSGGAPVGRDIATLAPLMQRATFRVEVIADSTASASAVCAALRAGLDGWHGTSLGVEVLRCVLTFEGEASYSEGDRFLKIVQQDYDVTHR